MSDTKEAKPVTKKLGFVTFARGISYKGFPPGDEFRANLYMMQIGKLWITWTGRYHPRQPLKK